MYGRFKMKIYLKLDSKNRIEYLSYDVLDPKGLVLVDVPDNHPIAKEGKVNYRYENGAFIEDNSRYEEWLKEQEKPQPTQFDYLLDLDFRLSMMELGL